MIILFSAIAALFCSAVVLFILLPAYGNPQKFSVKKSFVLLGVVCLGISASLLYYMLGDSRGLYNKMHWQEIEATHAQNNTDLRVSADFIKSLELQLQQHPDNGLNWILLGRIYFSAQDYPDAADAFKKAYEIYPQDPDVLVEYATSLYLGENNTGEEWKSVITKVEALSPQTSMSLSLLANMAYEAGDHAQAVRYWQTLLGMTPEDSPLHQTLQKTIADVNANLQAQS